MRIAYFADANCHHGSRWINDFAESNHVILFCAAGQTQFPMLTDKVLKFPLMPREYPLRNALERQRALAEMRSVLKAHDIEVLHSMYAVPYAFWAHQLGHANHVVTTRGSDVLVEYRLRFRNGKGLRERWRNRLLRWEFERALLGARVITSTSANQQRVLSAFVANRSKLHLVRTGVDVGAFDAVFDTMVRRTPPDELIVFCPRMIKPLYNTEVVVEGFARLRQLLKDRTLRLRLINYLSDRPYYAQVMALVERLGLGQAVEVLPDQDHVGLLQLYKDADVVVMVPRSDGTPVTGVETMLARKPLVLGAVDYDADLFDRNSVWRLASVTPEAVAETIREIVMLPREHLTVRVERARSLAADKAAYRTGLETLAELYHGRTPRKSAQTCSRCVLSNSDDSDIEFDADGECSHCSEFDVVREERGIADSTAHERLAALVERIRQEGRGRRYDSVIGVSGGTDSTYACYLAVKHGLRPLVVHLDNSWNTELAIQNIENLVTRLGLDLHTHVIDWEEFRDLQIAFLKASVIDIELLTDHAILAAMFKTAARLGVRYVVQGCNHATEAVLPPAWYHLKTDWLNIKDIHARYGTRRIKTFPHVGYFEWLYLTKVRGMSTVSILDYVHYDKAAAKSTIMRELGWRDYGGKHHESFFTRFYQTYILPRKFAVDKRKAHFSTLICSGQMTRQAALDELAKEVPAAQLLQDKEYVLKKWRLSEEEFEAYMKTPPRPHTDFASYVTRHQRYAEYVFAAVRPLRRAWGRAVGPRMTATRAVVDSDVKHRGE